MRRKIGFLVVINLAFASVSAAPNSDKAECEKVRVEIRKIESRMRSGYSGRQGEKLNEKLRKLKARRFRLCD